MLATSWLFPWIINAVCRIANNLLQSSHASSALDWRTWLGFSLWWIVLFPVLMSPCGAYIGFRGHAPPVSPHGLTIFEGSSVLSGTPLWWWLIGLASSVVPFAGSQQFPLFLALRSLWGGDFVFNAYGFVVIQWVLSTAMTAAVAVAVVYARLRILKSSGCGWWWCALGGGGLPVMAYVTYFYFTQLNLRGSVATALYFLYMSIVAIAHGVCMGAVSWAASYAFVRAMCVAAAASSSSPPSLSDADSDDPPEAVVPAASSSAAIAETASKETPVPPVGAADAIAVLDAVRGDRHSDTTRSTPPATPSE